MLFIAKYNPKQFMLIGLMLIGLFSRGQSSISGYGYDENNKPIPYAKVYIKNFTNKGSITDLDGKYFIPIDFGT